jgi:hypothetical protein
MKTLLRAVSVAILGAPAFAGAGHAQISEPGPYYSLPSWDQQFPVSTRFITLTNWASAAVLDRETGLVWQQNPSANGGTAVWAAALGLCQSTAIGGRFGWRLPAVEELSTLLDPTTGMLFSGAPFTLPTGPVFWTATTYAPTITWAFDVSFQGGLLGGVGFEPKGTYVQLWCVRGYQGAQNPQ